MREFTDYQKANIQRLCNALNSGEYQQAEGTLISVAPGNTRILGHCCLGVAASVVGRSVAEIQTMKAIADGINSVGGYLDENTAELFGFSSSDQKILAEMNDGHVPFEQIAVRLQQWVKGERDLSDFPMTREEEEYEAADAS